MGRARGGTHGVVLVDEHTSGFTAAFGTRRGLKVSSWDRLPVGGEERAAIIWAPRTRQEHKLARKETERMAKAARESSAPPVDMQPFQQMLDVINYGGQRFTTDTWHRDRPYAATLWDAYTDLSITQYKTRTDALFAGLLGDLRMDEADIRRTMVGLFAGRLQEIALKECAEELRAGKIEPFTVRDRVSKRWTDAFRDVATARLSGNPAEVLRALGCDLDIKLSTKQWWECVEVWYEAHTFGDASRAIELMAERVTDLAAQNKP